MQCMLPVLLVVHCTSKLTKYKKNMFTDWCYQSSYWLKYYWNIITAG